MAALGWLLNLGFAGVDARGISSSPLDPDYFARPAVDPTVYPRPGETAPRLPIGWETFTWEEWAALGYEEWAVMEFVASASATGRNQYKRPADLQTTYRRP